MGNYLSNWVVGGYLFGDDYYLLSFCYSVSLRNSDNALYRDIGLSLKIPSGSIIYKELSRRDIDESRSNL